MGITKPITIDHDRWYVQKAGRYWLLYNGADYGSDYIKSFNSWDKLIDYVCRQREIERSDKK